MLLEIPSYPYESEYNTPREKLLSVNDKVCRRYLEYLVDYVVTFS